MSDIFREVDEEVRQQQIIDFVKRYGKYVLAGIVVAIIFFVGIRYFQEQERQERAEAGDRFQAAMELLLDKKAAEAIANFAEVEEETGGDDGYGLLARFRRAEALYNTEQVQAAVDIYGAVAGDSGVAPEYRELAGVYAGMILLDEENYEAALEKLGPVAESGGTFRLLAMDNEALAHFQKGDEDTARELYQQVFDDAPPQTAFKQRAGRMLIVLGVAPEDLIPAE